MHGVRPGLVVIGEPLTFGTLGCDAALGIAELTGPGSRAAWMTALYLYWARW
jgi:hypothetical protein